MHISYSMTNVAKQCWKKYYWKYVECLEPIDQGHALKLGIIVHDAFYGYYMGGDPQTINKMIEESFEDELSKVEESDKESIHLLKAVAQGMWNCFPKDRLVFQSILPEHPFSIDFNGMPVEGRLDGLVQKDGLWWVREVKTTSLSQRAFSERMNVSEQALLYIWAARKMGFPVQGVVYDALHKPLLRKNQSENAQSFALRIRMDYKQRPEHYFQREFVYKTETDVKHFEEDLASFQRDLIIKREHGGYYRNANSCLGFNSECTYKKICFMKKPDDLTLNLFYYKKAKKDEAAATLDA